jgi:hypothetical protein
LVEGLIGRSWGRFGYVLPFLLALLLICAVAVVVIAAFATPHLQNGSPVLTPKGEQVMGTMERRLRPVIDAVWPRIRPLVRPLGRIAVRSARPVVRWLRRRLHPVMEPIIQAVAEGSASRPRPVATPRTPVPQPTRPGPAEADDDPSPAGHGIPPRRIGPPARPGDRPLIHR